MLQMGQAELAEKAGISKTGLANIEIGKTDPRASTLAAIQAALEAAGVEFTNGGQPGVRFAFCEASVAVRDGVEGVNLRRGRSGNLEWFSNEAAQEEALRMKRLGDTRLWLALTMISRAPAVTTLPEDGPGVRPAKRQKR